MAIPAICQEKKFGDWEMGPGWRDNGVVHKTFEVAAFCSIYSIGINFDFF
jgi:hypothetical protein